MGAARPGDRPSHSRADRRSARGVVEHRKHGGPRRRTAGAHLRPGPLDGVTAIGVDEHVWRHSRAGDKYVTVIIDLTPVREGGGPARLLDMVEGRSKSAFAAWLAARSQAWRDGIEVVAMDGFTGFKAAAIEAMPDTVTVMDPFHAVRLAGDPLDRCRHRTQQDLGGHRGRRHDPLYTARRTLHTGVELLTDRQRARLAKLFVIDASRRRQGHLGGLPADDRRLLPPRPSPGPADHGSADRLTGHRGAGRTRRAA